MFAPGQKVWHRNGQRSGTVLECDGNRAYIVQENGVEVDFRISDLTATSPEGVSAAEPVKPQARGAVSFPNYVMPTRTLTPRDITPEHVKVLETVPPRTLQAIAVLFERRPKAGKFSALDVAGKLNVIADITAIPYRTMREYIGRPGEFGLLMGKGLADSSKPN